METLGFYNIQNLLMDSETNSLNLKNILELVIAGLAIAFLTWIASLVWQKRNRILIWLKKKKLKYFPIDFNIAFSIDSNEGLNSGNYFNQIKKYVDKILNESNLYKQIVITDFSDIQKFRNKDEAELFRNNKGIDLIIWGGFTNDTLKINGEKVCDIELHFTFGYPENREKTIGKIVLLDINSKLAQKTYWKIVDNNSLDDIKIVSRNIFDISTYIIALTLKLYGRLEKSILLFEQLHENLVVRKDGFQSEILPHLNNLYQILIIENGIYGKDYNLGKNLCNKILNLIKDDFFALSNLATFECKLGNEPEAERLVQKLLKLYPKDPATSVDIAYFRILQNNFKNALQHYRNLSKFDTVYFDPLDVIEFLNDEYEKRKEPAFLFGIGYISYLFADKKLAKKNFNLFLRKANKIEYKLMCRETRKILKNLKAVN